MKINNYKEALEYIHSIPKFRRPLGNEKLNRLLESLDKPQRNLRFIHIAGTNGKGSCAAMTAAILAAQGYKTGLYTSPFIEVFNERIQINGKMIDNESLVRLTELVRHKMDENDAQVSEFAFITALAFVYFCEEKCDFVVLETGMGGRLDATNVIDKSCVSVLMSISLDHTQFLGETIEEIALEKCGIIKENGTVVSYPNEKVRSIIEEECKKKNADLTFAKAPQLTADGFVYENVEYALSLKGEYQPYNAAVVLEIIKALRKNGVEIDDKAVKYGLAHTSWQARFEFVRENVIIDGGHNPDGIHMLKKSLEKLDRKIVLVIAMMKDKSYAECIEDISRCAANVVATELSGERCLKAAEIGQALSKTNVPYEIEPNVKNAVERAMRLAGADGVVCICGSLYLAGEARILFKGIV